MNSAPTVHEATGEGIPILFSVLLVVLAIFAVWCATLVTAAGDLRQDLNRRNAWLGATATLDEHNNGMGTISAIERLAALGVIHQVVRSMDQGDPMDAAIIGPYQELTGPLGSIDLANGRLRTDAGAMAYALGRLDEKVRAQTATLTSRLSGVWTQLYLLIGATLLLVAVICGVMWVGHGSPPVPRKRAVNAA